MAFQIALAMATGLKFVVIDRADILDAESRGALVAMLLGSELDQAIVLTTTDKPVPEGLPDSVKFIQLGERACSYAISAGTISRTRRSMRRTRKRLFSAQIVDGGERHR